MIRFLEDIIELLHIVVFSVIISLLTGLAMFCLSVEQTLFAYSETARLKANVVHVILYPFHLLLSLLLHIISIPFVVIFRISKILIEITLGTPIDYEILVYSSCNDEETQ